MSIRKRSKEGRLSLRIDPNVKSRMLRYCQREGITLSTLVNQYFRELLKRDEERNARVDAESW